MRVRFEIIGSAASHIEINIRCQDLRMEFVGIQIDLNIKVRDHKKKKEYTHRGSILLSVFRILHFGRLILNTKHETPEVWYNWLSTDLLKLTQRSFKGIGSGIFDKHFAGVAYIASQSWKGRGYDKKYATDSGGDDTNRSDNS